MYKRQVKYTGSEAEGWQFEDCRGKGSLWATTTKDYDMTKDVITCRFKMFSMRE